jgi:O-antigen ligase
MATQLGIRRKPLAPGVPRIFTSLSALACGLVAIISSQGEFATASAVAAVAAAAALVLFAMEVGGPAADRAVKALLVFWFLAAPWLWYWVRLPAERSIVTFDRLVFGAMAAALIVRWWSAGKRQATVQPSTGSHCARARARDQSPRLHFSLTRFEVWWLVLTVIVAANVAAMSNHLGVAARTAADAFGLPLLTFYLARRIFDAASLRKPLIGAAIILALGLFATGAYELTGNDLFQIKGSELVRGQETRVNGPFATDSSFAIISVLLALFLRSAPRVFGLSITGAARLVYGSALGAVVAAALFPAYRGVALALFGALAVYEIAVGGRFAGRPHRIKRLALVFGARATLLAGVLLVVLVAVVALSPGLFGTRLLDPRNLFSRVATWEVALRVTRDNPVFGVGLWNFTEHFEAHYPGLSPLERALGTRITTGPHSNFLWVSSEMGLVGLVPYLAANVSLLLMGIRALRRSSSARTRAAAGCFLSMLVAYTLAGAGLASGAYSDLNLYFFFFLGVLSREMSVRLPERSAEQLECQSV